MKATKILRDEQKMIDRFLAAFVLGTTYAAQNRPVKPGFFIYASNFIKGYIEASYFKKEETLLKSLAENGVASDHGPLAQMFNEIKQSQELSEDIISGARQWQSGDLDGRNNVIWATSTFTSLMRQHIDRSRTIIFQLALKHASLSYSTKRSFPFSGISTALLIRSDISPRVLHAIPVFSGNSCSSASTRDWRAE